MMRDNNLNLDVSLPMGPDAKRISVADDPFAFARRLETPIWIYDIDNCRIIYANKTACHLWQAETEEELCERDLEEGMSTSVATRLKQYLCDFNDRDAIFEEMWTVYPGGKPMNTLVVFRGFLLLDGRMAMQCEVVGDSKEEPESLRSAEALLHTDVMIALFERGGTPFYMNPAARNASVISQQPINEKFVDQQDYKQLMEGLDNLGEHRMIAKVAAKDGQRWYDVSAKLCTDSVTGKPSILVTEVDVSELKNARDKARYLADSDQLTGCNNRAYLQQHIAMLSKFQTERCGLLCFDIDRFKLINDRFGHETGDVVLKEIAARVQEVTRHNDVVVRLGGDEFIVVFEDIPYEAEFQAIILRLLDLISMPIQYEETRINATVSMGVSTFFPDQADFTAVMREADIALYASKQAGRNRVTYFNDEMGMQAKARDQIELELKQGVERREFELHFQPRIDVQNDTVVSAEALVRWRHPERGIVMPGEFISVCEETGLIEDLGQIIIEMGCEQAFFWQNSGLDIELSINISPRQFHDPRLMNSLIEYSERPDFPVGKIELEITENVLIGDLDQIQDKLATISKLGYRIAIDDFGTGYSNLSYISHFALNCLKIDQTFVNQLPGSGPIMNLILTLAKQIGATVVAEGVEDATQMQWLRENGCDQVQGYYYSKPLEISKFMEFIALRKLPKK